MSFYFPVYNVFQLVTHIFLYSEYKFLNWHVDSETIILKYTETTK